MAHRHHLAQDSAAIFSPSVARIAASNARDWSYVDSWLASKFPGRPVPSFERNPDTLKALLSLASFNEAADEDGELIARAERDALCDIENARGTGQDNVLRDWLLNAVRDELPREGSIALDSLANVAVQAGVSFAETEELGLRLTDLQRRNHDAEQMKARIEILQRYIERDAERMRGRLRNLDSDNYKPQPHLAKENLEIQRRVKVMSTQLPELQDRAAALAASINTSHVTVDDVAREEQEYLSLLSQKRQLDLQIEAFEGLPSDIETARSELDVLHSQLRGATSRRDAVFEDLVERESPVKRRH